MAPKKTTEKKRAKADKKTREKRASQG